MDAKTRKEFLKIIKACGFKYKSRFHHRFSMFSIPARSRVRDGYRVEQT